MLCTFLHNRDAFFCLSAEEFLLKNSADDYFILWQSDKTVIVGRHQNMPGEIDYRFVRENGIQTARRISGGGTVYHDCGNVNFSIIKNITADEKNGFEDFLIPIVLFLKTLGIDAEFSGRNDLLIGGKKISGNAQHIHKNRILHHGTLLFDSDLQNLGNAIRVKTGKYSDKAVASHRSSVTNISDYLQNKIGTEQFIGLLLDYQLNSSPENRLFTLSDPEIEAIGKQVVEKFETWEWRFGNSPTYIFKNEEIIDDKIISLELRVEKGKIIETQIKGDFYSPTQQTKIIDYITGKPHIFEIITGAHKMTEIPVNDSIIFAWF